MAGFKTASGQDPLWGLVTLEATVQKAKLKAVVGVALILVGAVKLELSKPGTGKLRRRGKLIRGKRGRRGYRSSIAKLDRASAPGEPPAVDTGTLRNSINYEIGFAEGGRVRVGTGNEYAEPLEFGADLKNGRIEPRPFMRPALENVREAMGASIIGDLKSAVRK